MHQDAQESPVASRAREAADLDRDVLAMSVEEVIGAMADARYQWRMAVLDREVAEARVMNGYVSRSMTATAARASAQVDEDVVALSKEAIRWEHRFLIAQYWMRHLMGKDALDPTES